MQHFSPLKPRSGRVLWVQGTLEVPAGYPLVSCVDMFRLAYNEQHVSVY